MTIEDGEYHELEESYLEAWNIIKEKDARIAKLEKYIGDMHDDWFEQVTKTCNRYGLEPPVKKTHPLLVKETP